MTMRWRVLSICSDANRQAVETAMANWSLDLRFCNTLQEARSILRAGRQPIVLCEEKLPDGSYQDVLRLLGSKLYRTRVIVISDSDLDERYAAARAEGVFDVIASPCKRTDVQWIVIRAVQDHQHRNTFRPRSRVTEEAEPITPENRMIG
jgi:DNA-binding NtrC family response regulator